MPAEHKRSGTVEINLTEEVCVQFILLRFGDMEIFGGVRCLKTRGNPQNNPNVHSFMDFPSESIDFEVPP